jgi:hypothetical protein
MCFTKLTNILKITSQIIIDLQAPRDHGPNYHPMGVERQQHPRTTAKTLNKDILQTKKIQDEIKSVAMLLAPNGTSA